MTSSLDEQLLAAHASQDTSALVQLYLEAAEMASGDTARGFYLTHAYVFALEINHPTKSDIHTTLCALGREQ